MKRASVISRFLPPPIGGIDCDKPFVSGAPTTALDLVGFICRPAGLIAPYGPATLSSVVSAPKTIIPYGLGDYFLASNTAIYSSTGTLLIAITKGLGWYVNFQVGSGAYIFFANGADTPKVHNGTSWGNITFSGSFTPANLLQPWVHRHRLYFADVSKLSVWYGPADGVSGTLTEYNVGSIFRRKGAIAAVYSLSMDGGFGPDDLLAIFSTSGEVAIFSGNDPSSTDWSPIGVFEIGVPACGQGANSNPNFVAKLGGDLIVFTQGGVQSLTAIVRGRDPGSAPTISRPIDQFIRTYLQVHAPNSRYCYLAVIRSLQLLILVMEENLTPDNTPASCNGPLMMDLRTGAWSRFDTATTNNLSAGYGGMGGWTEIQFLAGFQLYAIDYVNSGVRRCFAEAGGSPGIHPGNWSIRYPYSQLDMVDPFRLVSARPNVLATAPSNSFSYSASAAYDFSAAYTVQPSTTYGGVLNDFASAEGLYGAVTPGTTARISRTWKTLPSHSGQCVSYQISGGGTGVSLAGDLRFLGAYLRLEHLEAMGP